MREKSSGNAKVCFAFTNDLRVLGALAVVISHIGGRYYSGVAGNAFSYLLMPRVSAPFLDRVFFSLSACGISFAHIGVSIFFIITGFCTPISLENKRFFEFWKSRLIRIYPTYMIAFSITFINIYIYSKCVDYVFPFSFKDWLIQISLLRDWLWNPSVDGLSWTLEVQMKQYLAISIFFACSNYFSSMKKIICKKFYMVMIPVLEIFLGGGSVS